MAMACSGADNMIFRSAIKADIPEIVALIHEMGWKRYLIHDVTLQCESFGYDSMLVVFDCQTLIGGCGAFIQDENHAYVSYVMVKSTHRRRGIARKMLRQVTSRLGKRNLILDSIPMYQSLYASFGFVQCDQDIIFINFKFPKLDVISDLPENIHKVTEESIPALVEYDRSLHSFGPRKFVEALLKDDPLSLFAKEQNGVSGMLITSTRSRFALYADDLDTAQKLIQGMMISSCEKLEVNESVIYNMVVPSGKLAEILSVMGKLGIQDKDAELKAHRMADGGLPRSIFWDKIYAFINVSSVIM